MCEQIGQTNIQSGEGRGDSGYYHLTSPRTLDMCHLNKLSMMTNCCPASILPSLMTWMEGCGGGPVTWNLDQQGSSQRYSWLITTITELVSRVTCHVSWLRSVSGGEEACPHQALVCHNVVISASLSATRHTVHSRALPNQRLGGKLENWQLWHKYKLRKKLCVGCCEESHKYPLEKYLS